MKLKLDPLPKALAEAGREDRSSVVSFTWLAFSMDCLGIVCRPTSD